MSTTPRLVGRVSDPIRQGPEVLDYTEILERDLGVEQDTCDRLRARVKALKAQVGRLHEENARLAGCLSTVPTQRGAPLELAAAVHRLESPGRIELTPGTILDSDAWRLLRANVVVQLSPTEWILFRQLVVDRGRLVPRERLVQLLLEFSERITGPEQTLRVNMSRLRTKLTRAGVGHLLTVVPFSGYRLEPSS